MCDCGCGTCSSKKPVVLNESLAPKAILSEGLKYHMDNALPLTEHVFRAGSTEYFNLWAEARALYARNILEVQGDDLEVLLETDLGNFGILEDGTKVPLDFPILEEGDLSLDKKRSIVRKIIDVAKKSGQHLSNEDLIDLIAKQIKIDTGGSLKPGEVRVFKEILAEEAKKKLNKEGIKVPLDFIMEDEYLDLNEGTFESNEIAIYDDPKGDAGETRIYKRGTGYYGENDSFDFEAKDKAELETKLKRWGYTLQAGSLDEAKKSQKKDPPVGKPMRDSSGGKAYKVYVRDPKTKKIKTVRFGSGGLKAKINNSKARQAFAKRHKCSTRNDKTKASYWSCRLPRYAKLLGLKSSFSGFW